MSHRLTVDAQRVPPSSPAAIFGRRRRGLTAQAAAMPSAQAAVGAALATLLLLVAARRATVRLRARLGVTLITFPLWPGRPHPCMKVFLPAGARANGGTERERLGLGALPALVVFRGGGWETCLSSGGGTAEWAAEVAGLVGVEVEYAAKIGGHPLRGPRLPEGSVLGELPDGESPYPQCLRDAARAVRLLRSLASDGQLPIDPKRVCACGFSAGGWLAAMLASTQAEPLTAPTDELSADFRCTPDRVVCCYAVTSLINADDPPRMLESYDLLLGPLTSDTQLRERLSPAKQLSSSTPPLFVWHTVEDPLVPSSHSLELYAAARAHGVAAELHLYAGDGATTGRHAQGLATNNPGLAGWSAQMLAWLGEEWRPPDAPRVSR